MATFTKDELSDLYDALDEAMESIGLALDAAPQDPAAENWAGKLERWGALRTVVGGLFTQAVEDEG